MQLPVKPMQHLVCKSQFARLAGVNKSTATRNFARGLSAAVVGDHIDLNHPDTRSYLKKRAADGCRASAATLSKLPDGGDVVEPPSKSKPKRTPPPPSATSVNEVPDDMQEYAQMPLYQIVQRFGTAPQFLDWLKAVREIENIEEKRIKNAVAKGNLVSIKLVETGVIDVFNSAHLRLLTDGAKTLASTVREFQQSGASAEELQDRISNTIGRFISPVKEKIERNLAGVKRP